MPSENSKITEVLQNFGLTENECQVYLILLKLGTATASEILEKTNVHRINLYDILERLQEKGIVSFVMLGKRKAYECLDPKNILKMEIERKNEIERILPELNAFRALSKAKQEATIFKDKKGIKNLLEEITRSKTPVLLFASGWGFKQNFPDYSETWHEKFKINKVSIKTLISSKFKGTQAIPSHFEYRYLPSEFQFPSTTCVWEDKILMMLWSAEPIGILIRSKDVSVSYKEFFEILWKTAKR